MMRSGSNAFLAAVHLFVLAPIIVVIVASFNTATSFPSAFDGFTLKWYSEIFDHPEFLAGIRISTFVAAVSAALASALGTAAAYGLAKRPSLRTKALVDVFLLPLLVPQVVIGLALLQIAGFLRADIGLAGLIAAHTVCGLPFGFRLAMSGLAHADFGLEEAAGSLGATRWQIVRFIVLPQIRPALVAGFSFAFILSFVNLPVSLFLTSPSTATLPIEMFAYMESRIDPLVAAISTLVIAVALVATILFERVFKIRIAG